MTGQEAWNKAIKELKPFFLVEEKESSLLTSSYLYVWGKGPKDNASGNFRVLRLSDHPPANSRKFQSDADLRKGENPKNERKLEKFMLAVEYLEPLRKPHIWKKRCKERNARLALMRKAVGPAIGCFFVVRRKALIEGLPWTEVPSIAGFRVPTTGHADFWKRLQRSGMAPTDMAYDECPRGQVTRLDAERRFILLADKCIIKNKRLVSRIMADLNLPENTNVVSDDQYWCPKCLGKKPTPLCE